jgi:parallel beta-helix repeat protein
MTRRNEEHAEMICPRTGRRLDRTWKHWWLPWVLPFVGAASLLWFLIRVLPKPSRSAYPCQRLAAPLAGGFVVWLTGLVASSLAYRRVRRLAGQARYVAAGLFAAVAVAAVWWSVNVTADRSVRAAFTPVDPPNMPIGIGQGIHPGRVVWVHDPEAAGWDGTIGAWWEDANVNQQVVDAMVSQALTTLTGAEDEAAAWDALFRHFNRGRNLGDVGYQRGEKIVIKINMNQDSGGTWSTSAGMPSPQMIHSVLDQLVHVAGVPAAALTLYDAARYIGDPIYNKIRSNPDFQGVQFVCSSTRSGRIGAVYDPTRPIHFADPTVPGNARAYVPRVVTEAKYLINMALLRSHSLFGVTFCGKNHFGSIYWPSNGGWTPSPLHTYGDRNRPMGSYNCLVDLIGHPQLGGKTLLYLIDGLYAARNQSAEVIRFSSFGNDWTSSLWMSQDPVAIDSVALDFIRNEPLETDCAGPGVDNYLHEAALANDPPSHSFYDPDGDGVRLGSLGVHEHWNNAVERKYSRNLGTGMGIELVTPPLTVADGPVENITRKTQYRCIRHAVQDANEGDTLVVAPGVYRETVSFGGKALSIESTNPLDPAIVATTVIEGTTEGVSFTNGEDAASVLAGFTIRGATRGVYCQGAAPTIAHCQIVENTEAGIKLWDSSHPTVANCIIAGNGGDGLEMWAGRGSRVIPYNDPTILHCTIVGNRGHGLGGGRPIVVNTIVRANALAPGTVQISTEGGSVTYSDVEGGYSGAGNLDADPMFIAPGYWADPVNPDEPAAPGEEQAVWVGGDYHLQPASPCIDAGAPVPDSGWALFDVDGQERPVGLRSDIGGDEFGPPIYLTWIGHASVKVTWQSAVVYVDPRTIEGTPRDATLILVTHSHSDHYSPADIAKVRNAQTLFLAPPDVVQSYGSGQALGPGQTVELAGLHITGVAAYNITKTNHPKANNWLGFLVELGGKRLYFAGDTDLTPEMKALTDIDVAFLPAGGTYTMDAVEAAEATRYFQPRLAIPYHWGTIVGTRADAERFASLAACNVKVMAPGEVLSSDDWQDDFSIVAHWQLDEAEGTVAADSAGGYAGVLAGVPLWQPTGGMVGGAIQLDGADDYVKIPPVLNPAAGNFSVFAWVKGGLPGQVILSQAGGVNWLMADAAAGGLLTQLKGSGRQSRDLTAPQVITDGQWHRVGLIWDGANRVLTVDGAEAARDTQAGLTGTTGGLYLGAGADLAPGTFWSGLLDDVVIHNRAINP